MEKPRKETLLNQNQDTRLCLNCGFPNRGSDTRCLYCQASLVEDDGLISWFRQTYYILKWRWQLKQKRQGKERPARMSVFKALGYFSVGAVLSGIGVYVFTQAISNSSFSKGLIAILFLVYGLFTLKSLFTKK